MGRTEATDLSLSCHLLLAALRDGQGNADQVGELAKHLYRVWMLQKAGYGDEPVETFQRAELALQAALDAGEHTGYCTLADQDVPVLARILALYDAQIAQVPLHRLAEASEQLLRFLERKGSSPVPEPDPATDA